SGEAQLILYTRYGDPREKGWENKWLNDWQVQKRFPWFPVEKIVIHKHFQPLLESAFSELELLQIHTEIKTIDETYHLRNIRGSQGVLSTHCWGGAIDMNAKENPLGSQGHWSARFIEAMESNNVFCGQSWTGRKAPMHFAMVNG